MFTVRGHGKAANYNYLIWHQKLGSHAQAQTFCRRPRGCKPSAVFFKMLLSPLRQVSVFIFPPIQASTIQQQSTHLNDNNAFKPAVKNHIQQVRLTYRGVIRPERQADNAELPAPVMTQQITQCRDESEGCSNHSLTGFHDGCCCACVHAALFTACCAEYCARLLM